MATGERPALLAIGHGSRSTDGVDAYWRFVAEVRRAAGDDGVAASVAGGFIEFAEPDLDSAVDKLVADGARHVVAVPLVLLGAGHLKNDGPAVVARGRSRHLGVRFDYGRDLGVHPNVLAVADSRIRETLAGGEPSEWAVVLVGRGSTDPDANADLFKVARLLEDACRLSTVEAAFVSLSPPGAPAALERARRLGAKRIAVVPYFLFTGVLVDRVGEQARAFAIEHPEVEVRVGPHLGGDVRLAELVLERFREATAGGARMNCDCCVYRTAFPGHEAKVGAPVVVHDGHRHTTIEEGR